MINFSPMNSLGLFHTIFFHSFCVTSSNLDFPDEFIKLSMEAGNSISLNIEGIIKDGC